MFDGTESANRFTATTRRQAISLSAIALGGLGLIPFRAWGQPDSDISRSAASIHQEPVFTASSTRVYSALTDPKQFDKIIELSGVLQDMHLGNQPAQISANAGGKFSLFGGYITGRNIELVPGRRLVQAWRTGGWPAGIYSIAKFELVTQGSGTKIVFDQTGFPNGEAESLAAGWKAHYWEPLAKLLA